MRNASTRRPRLPGWWTAPADPRLLAAARQLTCGFALAYLLVRLPALIGVRHLPAERFDPVGPVGVLLDAPLGGSAVLGAAALAVGSGLAATAGWRYRITGPIFALALLWVLTYRHSWGVVLHTDNLVVAHVGVLALTPAADAWSLDARRARRSRRGAPGEPGTRWAPSGAYRWPLVVMGAITAATYALAGWAKLSNGGWAWLDGDVLASHVAADNLRKGLLGDVSSPLAGPLLALEWLWAPLALASLVVELGAPLALATPRLGRVWTALAWAFHLGVLALMAILFPHQLTLVALAPWVLAGSGLPDAGPAPSGGGRNGAWLTQVTWARPARRTTADIGGSVKPPPSG